MRFAATHKTVSYLMVSAAFLMLVLTGEVPPLLAGVTGVLLLASFFFDPQAHPRMQSRFYAALWYLALLAALLLLLPDTRRGETLWDSATRFLCVFLCARMWRRRNNGDYLQAYLVSFLMLLVASLVGASVLYALCLLLYSVFATWTLTLFHLRREMEENYLLKHLPGRHGQAAESERVEVERILNSRRVVGTSFLGSTAALSVVFFLIAGMVFLLLPRIGVGLDLPLRRRGLLLTGFAEQIQLGGHGVLRENPRVVMRIESPGGAPPIGSHFRGVAFDHYQDGRWSRSPLAAPGALATTLKSYRSAERVLAPVHGYHFIEPPTDLEVALSSLRSAKRSEVYLEPLDSTVLFVPGPEMPLAVTLPPSWYFATPWPLLIGSDDELVVRSRPGSLHYTVYSSPQSLDPTKANFAPPPAELSAYLQLPANLPPRVAALAKQLTAEHRHPHEQVQALVSYLQNNYAYTTQLPKMADSEPLDAFLFDRKRGHCEYFASALAILLRTLGIPSRSVNGYFGGEWNEYGHYLVVRQQHAHSWVEAYLSGVGWVSYDPTPLSALLPPQTGLLWRARKLADSLEMSWNKYILEYDLRTQQRLSDKVHLLLRPSALLGRAILNISLWLLIAVVLGFAGWLTAQAGRRFLRNRHYRQTPVLQVQYATQDHLRRALRVLRRRGFEQRPGETLRQLAERVVALGEPSGAFFAELVRHYYAHRFGLQAIDLAIVSELTSKMAQAPQVPASSLHFPENR